MTVTEEANELVEEFLSILYAEGSFSFKHILYEKAKQCAIITIHKLMQDCTEEKKEYYKEVIVKIYGFRYETI
jgi:hypothetical protein